MGGGQLALVMAKVITTNHCGQNTAATVNSNIALVCVCVYVCVGGGDRARGGRVLSRHHDLGVTPLV